MDVVLEGIAVRFGEVQALRGVDVALPAGRVTVLVGPNGAGKSTLLSVLLGLVTPDAGTVRADGRALVWGRFGLDPAYRARLAYLPEAVAFSEVLTGTQVLSFFARARGVPQARVRPTLERVGLLAAADRVVAGYSRGMRQRLGLGISLIGEPELLVLDEPTSGLDQQGIGLLWEVLAEWRAAGKSVVLTTHDLALIERRADHLLVFAQGRVLAEGTPDQLRRSVHLPIRLRLTVASEHVDLAFSRLKTLGHAVRFEDGAVIADLDPDRLRQAIRVVDDLDVLRTRVEEPGLDEIYEALIVGSAA
jgi:Cu-processing system ATP-binding protein